MNRFAVCLVLGCLSVPFAGIAAGKTRVDVSGVGAEKLTVTIDVANADFARCLQRNLELSGAFVVGRGGSVRVSGVAGSSVKAEGAGKAVTVGASGTDAKSLRMSARQLSDAMCKAYADHKGFACDRIAFVKKGTTGSEICQGYPDGQDVEMLTHDGKIALGPRWKNAQTIYYVGYLTGGQQIYELDVATGKRRLAWNIRGVASPAVVSPDGRKVAIAASFQGNPELYVLSGGKLERLTFTKGASEGQPTWSPDGREIAYVSDESRRQHVYVINVATKAKRRLTSSGSQNVDPDWGPDGRITYITKRNGGAQVAVIEPAEGERSVKLVTDAGNWEHPSWSRDARTLVASRDGALFAVDTLTADGAAAKPVKLFNAQGKWITPVWSR